MFHAGRGSWWVRRHGGVMAHDEATEKIASRGSDWDQCARRQVAFDDPDSIIDASRDRTRRPARPPGGSSNAAEAGGGVGGCCPPLPRGPFSPLSRCTPDSRQ